MVADSSDVVLRLPDTSTLDARTRVERVDDAPPEEVVRDRRRRNEDVPRDRRRDLGLARSRLAEQKPESWSGGTELTCRRHREVELQCIRQQEHAVGGRSAHEISKGHRVEFLDQRARPIVEDVCDRHLVDDAEGEVQVGEAVTTVHGKRAHGGSSNDAPILLREP